MVFAYQELVVNRLYPPHPVHEQAASTVPSPKASAVATAAAPGPKVAPGPTVGQAPLPQAVTAAPVRQIEVDTDLFKADFTSRGGRLKSLELKKYRKTVSPTSPLFQMVRPTAGGIMPLAAVIETKSGTVTDRRIDYATNAPSKLQLRGSQRATVIFTAVMPDGLRVVKTLTFTGSGYVFDLGLNVSGSTKVKGLGVAMTQPLKPSPGSYYNTPVVQADVKGRVLADEEKSIKKPLSMSGPITYAGFGDRYFLTAFLPKTPDKGVLTTHLKGDDATARLMFPGVSHIETQVFAGPKALQVLDAINPKLHEAIDFGWFSFLSLPFLRILEFFHDFAPNWGWDIILITIGIRLLTLPMSIKGTRSMMKMQRLAPQMEKIRGQFKDEPERMQREMMDMYKRNHVSPLGGCAPMLVQLPIFIALYDTLLAAVELRHAPFIWWIKDLSAPDCYPVSWIKIPYMHCHGIPVLVLLMGISTFVQQWMTPMTPDPSQQKMMMVMPVVMTVVLVNFPAGLSLYYFASNILGIIQQIFLNREFKQMAPAT